MYRICLLLSLLFAASTAAAQPRTIAHRGHWRAAGSAQNTLASLAKADSIGCYGSEFDVWLTADNRLVVNHDRVDASSGLDMERSHSRAIRRIRTANGEPIPTLDAYLRLAARCPSTHLVLEIKTLSTPEREREAVRRVVRKLRRYGLLERTDVISFSQVICREARALLPANKVFYLTGDLEPERIAELGLTGIDYHSQLLIEHPDWIRRAHDLGLEVNVWTVNDDAQLRHFIDAGVDYITTDCPDRLLELLAERR